MVVERSKQILKIEYEEKSCRDYFGKKASIFPEDMENENWIFTTKDKLFRPKSFPEKFEIKEHQDSFSTFMEGKALIVPEELNNQHIEWAGSYKTIEGHFVLYGVQAKALKIIPSFNVLGDMRQKFQKSMNVLIPNQENIKIVEIFYFNQKLGNKKTDVKSLKYPTIIMAYDAIKDIIQPSFLNLFEFICLIPQDK